MVKVRCRLQSFSLKLHVKMLPYKCMAMAEHWQYAFQFKISVVTVSETDTET